MEVVSPEKFIETMETSQTWEIHVNLVTYEPELYFIKPDDTVSAICVDPRELEDISTYRFLAFMSDLHKHIQARQEAEQK